MLLRGCVASLAHSPQRSPYRDPRSQYFYNDVCVGADAIIFIDCVLDGDVDFDAHIEFESAPPAGLERDPHASWSA